MLVMKGSRVRILLGNLVTICFQTFQFRILDYLKSVVHGNKQLTLPLALVTYNSIVLKYMLIVECFSYYIINFVHLKKKQCTHIRINLSNKNQLFKQTIYITFN